MVACIPVARAEGSQSLLPTSSRIHSSAPTAATTAATAAATSQLDQPPPPQLAATSVQPVPPPSATPQLQPGQAIQHSFQVAARAQQERWLQCLQQLRGLFQAELFPATLHW